MTSVNNNPINTPGFYHHKNDEIKTTTALRATYNPSLSDRITNHFVRTKNEVETNGEPGKKSRVAVMVNAVRNLDLSLRVSANKRRYDSARNNLRNMKEDLDADDPALAAQRNLVNHHEHVRYRLKDKQAHAAAALEGKLDKKIASSNEKLKARLEERNYEPLKGLSDVKLDNVQSRYLSSPEDHHRIQIHTDGARRLTTLIASMRSADHDRGATGILPRSRSIVQHALVGIQGAYLTAKGEITDQLAKRADLDDGARARMEVRSERAAHDLNELRAALGGNESLKRARQLTVERQIASARERAPAADDVDVDNATSEAGETSRAAYVTRSARDGVKPFQTRLWERRVNQYYQPSTTTSEVAAEDADTLSLDSVERASNADREVSQSDAGSTPRKGRLARFAERVSNARDDRNVRNTAGKLALAKIKLESTQSTEQQALNQRRIDHYEIKAQKAEVTREARRSMWQGKLMDTLNSSKFQQWENKTFEPRDELHEELPWKRNAEE